MNAVAKSLKSAFLVKRISHARIRHTHPVLRFTINERPLHAQAQRVERRSRHSWIMRVRS